MPALPDNAIDFARYARPIDVTYALLLAAFTALLGFVGGIVAT